MEIDVELPKKRTIRYDQLHRRVRKKGFPMLVPLKKEGTNLDEFAVIKRYKTDRGEDSRRFENEFI